jgi:AraC family transcriptional regulator
MNSTEYIPAAVPGLIDAAVLAFDADRDTSRRYLLRASALLGVKRGRHGVQSTRLPERRGLMAWQLDRIVGHVETHLADKITVTDLANLIEVSATQLFRAFKISVGVTPCHYIARRRVEFACTMMSTTREPLSQVAVGCGMCDQAHFSRVFRRMIGTSPSTWRRGAGTHQADRPLVCGVDAVIERSGDRVQRPPVCTIGPLS